MRPLLAALVLTAVAAGPAAAAPLAVRTDLAPSPARFGDVLVATVTVTPDSSVDPAAIDVRPGLAPYEALGEPARSTADGAVTFRYEISCLVAACVPPRSVRLAPARARARTRGGDVVEQRADWPRLRVVPRVSEDALARTPLGWRQQLEPAAPSYRVRPGVLAAVLAAVAALLVAGAVALVAVELRRRRRAIVLADPRLPRERALALLRESVSRPAGDRRKALALVSHELPEAERAATELAWSRHAPEADRVARFAKELEQEPAAP